MIARRRVTEFVHPARPRRDERNVGSRVEEPVLDTLDWPSVGANAGNAQVWTGSFAYNAGAGAFTISIPSGALAAGSYRIEVTVNGPVQSQKTSAQLACIVWHLDAGQPE